MYIKYKYRIIDFKVDFKNIISIPTEISFETRVFHYMTSLKLFYPSNNFKKYKIVDWNAYAMEPIIQYLS